MKVQVRPTARKRLEVKPPQKTASHNVSLPEAGGQEPAAVTAKPRTGSQTSKRRQYGLGNCFSFSSRSTYTQIILEVHQRVNDHRNKRGLPAWTFHTDNKITV